MIVSGRSAQRFGFSALRWIAQCGKYRVHWNKPGRPKPSRGRMFFAMASDMVHALGMHVKSVQLTFFAKTLLPENPCRVKTIMAFGDTRPYAGSPACAVTTMEGCDIVHALHASCRRT
jgi:hypothetical protein